MLETADMLHNLADTSGAAALAMISPRMDLSMVFCGGVQPIIRLDIGRYFLPWRHEAPYVRPPRSPTSTRLLLPLPRLD